MWWNFLGFMETVKYILFCHVCIVLKSIHVELVMQKRRDFPDELKILSTIYPKFCILIAIHVIYKICIELLEAPLRDIFFFKLYTME